MVEAEGNEFMVEAGGRCFVCSPTQWWRGGDYESIQIGGETAC